MNTFARTRWPLFAVAAILAVGLMAAHFGYMDPTHLVAAPLLFPLAHTVPVDEPLAKQLRALQAKRATLVEAATKATAGAVDGVLSAEQQKIVDDSLAAVGAIDGDMKRLSALIEANRGAAISGIILETRPNVLDDPKRGFKSMGDFAIAVKGAAVNPGRMDDRLRVVAANGASEAVGADGGYLVPIEFSKTIAQLSLEGDAFLPMTDQIPITGNGMAFPSDETTPWGSDGIRAYWEKEAATTTKTKPKLQPNAMRLNKLFALVPVTDELLSDAPALGAYVTNGMGRSIRYKSNDSLINGDGAGMPLGVLQGGALVVVAKDNAQAANTLSPTNVANMYARMPADYLAEAFWLIAPDALPSLMTMTLNNYAIWTPPSTGFAGAPGGFLFGKPVKPSQSAAAFSSQGDIAFINLRAYRTISKDGVQIAESMHLYFDTGETAFRATFRLDGQPTFKNQITQARGTNKLSPYVTLAAR